MKHGTEITGILIAVDEGTSEPATLATGSRSSLFFPRSLHHLLDQFELSSQGLHAGKSIENKPTGL